MNYYYLGNNLGLRKLGMGYKMLVDTRDLSLGAHVIADGYWAQHIDQFMSKVIKKGDRCMDLGCHMGYTAMLMHGLSQRPVDFVDMNRDYVDLTEKNFELNGLVGKGTKCAIITNEDASPNFVYYKDDERSGGAHLSMSGSFPTDTLRGTKLYPCMGMTPEKVVGSGKYDFVKIDLEGMDWFVMDKIDVPKAIIEHRPHDARSYNGKDSVHDTFENCISRVFKKYRVEIIQGDGTGKIVTTVNQIIAEEHLDLYLERR
jgi:hypothetical protein